MLQRAFGVLLCRSHRIGHVSLSSQTFCYNISSVYHRQIRKHSQINAIIEDKNIQTKENHKQLIESIQDIAQKRKEEQYEEGFKIYQERKKSLKLTDFTFHIQGMHCKINLNKLNEAYEILVEVAEGIKNNKIMFKDEPNDIESYIKFFTTLTKPIYKNDDLEKFEMIFYIYINLFSNYGQEDSIFFQIVLLKLFIKHKKLQKANKLMDYLFEKNFVKIAHINAFITATKNFAELSEFIDRVKLNGLKLDRFSIYVIVKHLGNFCANNFSRKELDFIFDLCDYFKIPIDLQIAEQISVRVMHLNYDLRCLVVEKTQDIDIPGNYSIRIYSRIGDVEKAISHFHETPHDSILPNTFFCLFSCLEEFYPAVREIFKIYLKFHQPNIVCYNHLIRAAVSSNSGLVSNEVYLLLEEMGKYNIEPDDRTFSFLINRFIKTDDIFGAVQFYERMKDAGIKLSDARYYALLHAAKENNLFQLYDKLSKEQTVAKADRKF